MNTLTPIPISKRFGFAKLISIKGVEYFIRSPTVTLGRCPDTPMTPQDIYTFCPLSHSKQISRKHARIFFNFTNLQFEIICICRNDIFIDKKLVSIGQEPVPLKHASSIVIGDTILIFQIPIDFWTKVRKCKQKNILHIDFDNSGNPPDLTNRPNMRIFDILKSIFCYNSLQKMNLNDILEYIENRFKQQFPSWIEDGSWKELVKVVLDNNRFFEHSQQENLNDKNQKTKIDYYILKTNQKSGIKRPFVPPFYSKSILKHPRNSIALNKNSFIGSFNNNISPNNIQQLRLNQLQQFVRPSSIPKSTIKSSSNTIENSSSKMHSNELNVIPNSNGNIRLKEQSDMTQQRLAQQRLFQEHNLMMQKQALQQRVMLQHQKPINSIQFPQWNAQYQKQMFRQQYRNHFLDDKMQNSQMQQQQNRMQLEQNRQAFLAQRQQFQRKMHLMNSANNSIKKTSLKENDSLIKDDDSALNSSTIREHSSL